LFKNGRLRFIATLPPYFASNLRFDTRFIEVF